MGTLKNRLNKTVCLSTQNICYKLWERKYLQFYAVRVNYPGPPDKSAYSKINFFCSHLKHMLWALKRTVSMRRPLSTQNTMLKLIDKKMIKFFAQNVHLFIFLFLMYYCKYVSYVLLYACVLCINMSLLDSMPESASRPMGCRLIY